MLNEKIYSYLTSPLHFLFEIHLTYFSYKYTTNLQTISVFVYRFREFVTFNGTTDAECTVLQGYSNVVHAVSVGYAT